MKENNIYTNVLWNQVYYLTCIYIYVLKRYITLDGDILYIYIYIFGNLVNISKSSMSFLFLFKLYFICSENILH